MVESQCRVVPRRSNLGSTTHEMTAIRLMISSVMTRKDMCVLFRLLSERVSYIMIYGFHVGVARIVNLMVNCGNVYPYTVTDDRFGRNKKRKDNGNGSFPTRLY